MMVYKGGEYNGQGYSTMIDVGEELPVVGDNLVAVLGCHEAQPESTIDTDPAMLVFNTETNKMVYAETIKTPESFMEHVEAYAVAEKAKAVNRYQEAIAELGEFEIGSDDGDGDPQAEYTYKKSRGHEFDR